MLGYFWADAFECVLAFLVRRKRKNEEWNGILEDKKIRSGYSLAKQRHVLVFRKEDGKKIKIRAGTAEYERYEKGKRYHKRSGELLPDPVTGMPAPPGSP
jgi:hypothetical protein